MIPCMTHTPHPAVPATPARAFTPVPVRPRSDGWTPERQAGFIEALAACGCVSDAAARVGMASDGAYDLRRREGSFAFREAWDAALAHAVKRLSEAAFSRALHGVVRPHYYKGELVGEHRVFNEGLTRFLLQHLDRGRYSPPSDIRTFNRDEDKIIVLADAVREILAEGDDGATVPDAKRPPRRSPGWSPSEHWTEQGPPGARRAKTARPVKPRENLPDADIPPPPIEQEAVPPLPESAAEEGDRIWLDNGGGITAWPDRDVDGSPVSPVYARWDDDGNATIGCATSQIQAAGRI